MAMEKENTRREYMPFFRSFYEALNYLADNDQLQLYRAIVAYGLDGVEPENLTGVAAGLWAAMFPNIKNSRTRYENGKKGGAPMGNRNAAKNKEHASKGNGMAAKKKAHAYTHYSP